MESMPIEYEFVALDARANQPLKIRHVSGGIGDSVFLYPGKYNLFAVISGGTSDQDRRVQISAQGNKVLRLNEGINDISIAATEFFQPLETTVKWQLPSGTDKQVNTTFKVLTEIQGYGRTYQQSAYSSCNTSECKLIALRGQSIEVIATTYKSGLVTKKILRIGDEDTVNLTLAPIEK